jgi:hypothetical protein
MKFHGKMAASGLALCAFLVSGRAIAQDADAGRVDANGMPTTHSTPAEKVQTNDLNQGVAAGNVAVDQQAQQTQQQTDQTNAQYQQQQQQYQSQQGAYEAQKESYAAQMGNYTALRDRYQAARAAYRRDPWPHRYEPWVIHDDAGLTGSRVQIVNGDNVGTVIAVARTPSSEVDALRIKLDSGQTVWLDRNDVRFDHGDRIVMTDLDRADLHEMADEHL